MSSDQDSLREELRLATQDTPLDLGKIATITARLLETDPSTVRFSVDAGHLRRLGSELIGRADTALAELVKNAFDADATEVLLAFSNSDRPGGRLLISDNGTGMTKEELLNGFMRLSTTSKVREPHSRQFGRLRAGRKGIGRFATQRLGSKLTVTTQVQSAERALQISLYWDDFEAGRELAAIGGSFEEVEKGKEHGTDIEIAGLEEAWSDSRILQTARQLRAIALPDFRATGSSRRVRTDPGIRIWVKRDDADAQDVALLLTDDLEDLALAVVSAKVTGEGRVEWSLHSARLGIAESFPTLRDRDEKEVLLESARDVSVLALYFIYEKGLLPPRELPRIRDIATSGGGLRLYRNGFRVLPYGEPGDDWLSLDALSRQRSVLPAIANVNWIGRVAINDVEGHDFQETTSREGLIHNSAFAELAKAVRLLLESAVKRVAAMRGRKQSASDDAIQQRQVVALAAATAVEQGIAALAASVKSVDPTLATQLGNLLVLSRQATDVAAGDRERAERYLSEIAMLRVLASFGIVIGEFVHEARMHIQELERTAASLETARDPVELQNAARTVGPSLRPLRLLLGYFERSFAEQARRETRVVELADIGRDFLSVVESDARTRSINITFQPLGSGLFTRPMHESEWSAVLFNLYSNAKKAIQRSGGARNILVRAGRSGRELFLDMSDTGDGVPEDSRDRIFDAFFTTSAGSRDLETEPAGLGLGLSIVRDIVDGYGGHIAVVDPPSGFSTCIRAWVPSAQADEIPDYVV